MWKVEFDCFTDSFFQWFILHNWQTRVLWIDRPAVVPLLMIDFSVLPLKLYRHLSVFPQREAARAHRSAKRVTMQLTGKVDNRGNACVVSSSFSLCLLLNEKKKKKKPINPKTWKVTSSCAWGVYRWAVRQDAGEGSTVAPVRMLPLGCVLISPLLVHCLKGRV